jgi:cytochrome bd-type quinol oxidase subunit 1
MDRFRAVAAVVIVAIFVALGYFLIKEADTASPTSWERWVYVFGAAEAIAFTAIGWIFGREVNRQRAEKADQAEADAKQEAKRGSILAGMVRTAAGGKPGVETMGAGAGGDLSAAVAYAAKEYGA